MLPGTISRPLASNGGPYTCACLSSASNSTSIDCQNRVRKKKFRRWFLCVLALVLGLHPSLLALESNTCTVLISPKMDTWYSLVAKNRYVIQLGPPMRTRSRRYEFLNPKL
jgi:hypothetical protein